ncbi:MAG: helix-turn-helix domain-containing protein, partial [Polyangiaceae bacterium]
LRKTLADRYLHDGSVRVSEAAALLGFAHPSAFDRAFKRWYGTSPQERRRRAR